PAPARDGGPFKQGQQRPARSGQPLPPADPARGHECHLRCHRYAGTFAAAGEARLPLGLVLSRRQFLGVAAAACAAAGPPGAPIGLHIRADGDLRTKLREAAAIGFREVEIAAWRDIRATELRKPFEDNGLTCHSAHWTLWENDADSQATIDAAVELGLEYLVTPLPSLMGREWFEANETPAGRAAVSQKMQL